MTNISVMRRLDNEEQSQQLHPGKMRLMYLIGQLGNCKCPPHPRNENLRRIRKVGPQKWNHESGYHRRSLSESTMFRLTVLFKQKSAIGKLSAIATFMQQSPTAL